MNASISLSIKLNIKLMLVGLLAGRKTEMQNLTFAFLFFSMQAGRPPV